RAPASEIVPPAQPRSSGESLRSAGGFCCPRFHLARCIQVPVEAIEGVGSQFQSLLDVITAGFIIPERLDHGKKLFSMTLVDLGMQLVVNKTIRRNPAALDRTLADDGGNF